MPQYKCDECGACCRQLIIEIQEVDLIREPRLIPLTKPFKVPKGMELIDEETGRPYEEQVPGYGNGALLACGANHPCPVLEGNRCGIYPTRPTECVAFRAGSRQCQESRAAEGLAPLLPAEGKP